MKDQLRRLNTFIPDDVFRGIKIVAAETGQHLHIAVAKLLSLGIASYGESRKLMLHDPLLPTEELPHVIPKVEGEAWTDDPSIMARCGICGLELPESAKQIHETNCQKAQEGYWDKTSFRA
jgi:hypothetical protein